MRITLLSGFTATAFILAMAACGGGSTNDGPPGAKSTPPGAAAAETKAPSGLITAADITLGDIDAKMVDSGKGIYELKCQACHSLGANRVVGPGWKGVTERRAPEWIMNMMLTPDIMLDSDPEAQKQLEECLVRMPNQSLSKADGRNVLEFMRTL
ncbi:MAG: cytochrome c [Flavobacteriales bacterium]|nr:cytochrome c [Flavobacteriales bacterium]